MPIEVTNSQFMFIQPNNPYLAISQNNQQFIPFCDVYYNKCTLGVTIKYCKFLQLDLYNKTFTPLSCTQLPVLLLPKSGVQI
jgi:hypothetical protein